MSNILDSGSRGLSKYSDYDNFRVRSRDFSKVGDFSSHYGSNQPRNIAS